MIQAVYVNMVPYNALAERLLSNEGWRHAGLSYTYMDFLLWSLQPYSWEYRLLHYAPGMEE